MELCVDGSGAGRVGEGEALAERALVAAETLEIGEAIDSRGGRGFLWNTQARNFRICMCEKGSQELEAEMLMMWWRRLRSDCSATPVLV